MHIADRIIFLIWKGRGKPVCHLNVTQAIRIIMNFII